MDSPGLPSQRKFSKYDSVGHLPQQSSLPPATANPSNPSLVLGESASVESLDYPLYHKKTEPKMKKPNIHLKELSFFIKVLDAKVRFDPQL